MSDVIQERNADASRLRPERAPAPNTQAADWPTFRAASQLETAHWLIQALGASESLVAVTGDAGVGKSVVAAVTAAQLGARGYLVISAPGPFAGPLELQAVLAQGLDLPRSAQTTPLAVATAVQGRRAATAKPVVLMIDAAETLPPLVLQYLWLMHRLCGSGSRALQMVFVGRLAFWDHLAAPELAGLRDAIAVRTALLPLADGDALAYMRHRLEHFGVAEPAAIPRKLAREILVLGQGVPSRINVIADAIVAHEPKRLRVTPKVVRAAATMLAGGSAMARVPEAQRPGGRILVAGMAAAAAAALAGWLLLGVDKPKTSIRTAALPLLPAAVAPTPPPHTPTPPRALQPEGSPPQAAPVQAPAAQAPAAQAPAAQAPAAQGATSLVPAPHDPPVPVVAPVAEPPEPPASAAVVAASPPAPADATTRPATAAPPVVVLPDAAMPRIIVQYPAADPGVAAHALSVVTILRARGLSVGDPVSVAEPARSTGVEYYFAQDRAEATQLARELGGSVSMGRLEGRNPDASPAPGTLRVLLSNRGVSSNVSIPASVPASAAKPEGSYAPPPIPQEPP